MAFWNRKTDTESPTPTAVATLTRAELRYPKANPHLVADIERLKRQRRRTRESLKKDHPPDIRSELEQRDAQLTKEIGELVGKAKGRS